MSKYDFSLDLSDNSSTGLMIKKIRKGSVILEFGCATGRMTKYMTETLDCKVYIVEYDRSAYDSALQFAADGICDDIMNFAWLEKFEAIRFDAILFADVLEHLSDPEHVVRECSKLLKENGQIHISIPNITHNDVILRFLHNDVNYTKVGLLDDTHVHFWGLNNIKIFAEHCGLHVKNIEATYCPTGFTEQRPAMDDLLTKNVILYDILKQRPCGEVYQFLIDLQKEDTDPIISLHNPFVVSHVYLDRGDGFNSQDVLEVAAEPIGDNAYQCHWELEDTEGIRAFRFDPIEMQNCIIQKLSAHQGKMVLSGKYSASLRINDEILMLDQDSQVIFEVTEGKEKITLEAQFLLPGTQMMHKLQKGLLLDEQWKVEKTKETEEQHAKIEQLLTSLEEKEKEYEKLSSLLNTLEQENVEKFQQCEKMKAMLENAKGNCRQMEKENETHLQHITQLQNEKEALNGRLQQYIDLLDQKERMMLATENELNYYKSHSMVGLWIKLRNYILKIKKLLGKAETH